MDAWPGPRHRVNHGGEFIRLAVGGIGRGPFVKGCRVEGGPSKHALSHAQEGGHVGGHRNVGAMGGCRKAGLHVDVGPSRRRAGDAVAVGRDLSKPRPQDQKRVGLLEPLELGERGGDALGE